MAQLLGPAHGASTAHRHYMTQSGVDIDGAMLHVDPGEVVTGVADKFADGGVGEGYRGPDAEFAARDFGSEAVDIVDSHGNSCPPGGRRGCSASLEESAFKFRGAANRAAQAVG